MTSSSTGRAWERQRRQQPTFIAVDYATIGAAFAADDDINGVSSKRR